VADALDAPAPEDEELLLLEDEELLLPEVEEPPPGGAEELDPPPPPPPQALRMQPSVMVTQRVVTRPSFGVGIIWAIP